MPTIRTRPLLTWCSIASSLNRPRTAAPKDGARPERTLRVAGRELADWPPVGSPVGTALVARREHRFALYAGNPRDLREFRHTGRLQSDRRGP
jgi:hypothetical protein